MRGCRLRNGLCGRLRHRTPNTVEIVLHPARLWVVLGEVNGLLADDGGGIGLRHIDNQHCGSRCTLVDCQYELRHLDALPLRVTEAYLIPAYTR